MKIVALLMACVGAALAVLGLLSFLEVVNVGPLGEWAAIPGIAISLAARVLFSRAERRAA